MSPGSRQRTPALATLAEPIAALEVEGHVYHAIIIIEAEQLKFVSRNTHDPKISRMPIDGNSMVLVDDMKPVETPQEMASDSRRVIGVAPSIIRLKLFDKGTCLCGDVLYPRPGNERR